MKNPNIILTLLRIILKSLFKYNRIRNLSTNIIQYNYEKQIKTTM